MTKLFWFLPLLVLVCPEPAWAWGPSAHLYFGLQILEKISMLPSGLQVLLGFHQPQFLYGSISADIIVGKKFIAYRHHCHNWAVGLDLLKRANDDSLKAFMLGYMSHLAADCVAHNLFVPVKTVESFTNKAMGHLYWELMFDFELKNPRILDMFYSLSRNPFVAEDRFLQGSLKPTLFSFTTNKKIFNGLLILQRLHRWQDLMSNAAENRGVPLTQAEVNGYSELSLNAILSFLIDRENSIYCRIDPTGSLALDQAASLSKALRQHPEEAAPQIFAATKNYRENFDSQLKGLTHASSS